MIEILRGPVLALALAFGCAGAVAVGPVTEAQAFGLGDIVSGVKKVGSGAKKAAVKVGKGIQAGGKKLDGATRKAAKTVGKGVESAGKAVGRGAKATAKGVYKGAKKVVKCLAMRCVKFDPKIPPRKEPYPQTAKRKQMSKVQPRGAPMRKVKGITRQNLQPNRKAKSSFTKTKNFSAKNIKRLPASKRMAKRFMDRRANKGGNRRIIRGGRVKVEFRSNKRSRKSRRGRRN